ncbi:Nucleotide-binding oligomerization domain-containing 2, partial [Paramuricea clavata]
LSHVAIPCCLRLANPNKMELHLFSDASKDAYASVAYLVCQYEDDSPTSRLVASKCRVAPTKAIPRLELMGAILSSRLAQSLLKVLTVDRVIFWTDSQNVCHWVRNHSRQFKPFVANRIAEIQRTTSPEQWRHVPGIQNPADLATRDITIDSVSKRLQKLNVSKAT